MSNNKFTIIIDGVDNATPVVRGVESEVEKLTANLVRINGVNPSVVRRPIVQAIRPANQLADRLDRIGRGLNAFGAKGPANFLARLGKISRLNTPPAPNTVGAAATAGEAGSAGEAVGAARALAGGAALSRIAGPLAALVALGEASRALTRSFGDSSMEIINNARMLSMSTDEYQKLINTARMLKISPEEMTNGMLSFAMGANKAGKGFDPGMSYAMNVLGVKMHRIGGNDADIRAPIDKGRLLRDILTQLNAANVSPESKMELLQATHLPIGVLNMTYKDQLKLAEQYTRGLSLSPAQLEEGRKLDMSNTERDIKEQRLKQGAQAALSPLARLYNGIFNGTADALLGNGQGQVDAQNLPGQMLTPQDDSMRLDSSKPRPILLPPVAPAGGASAPAASPVPVEVHITNNGGDTQVKVKQGGAELPVRVYNFMSMDPQ